MNSTTLTEAEALRYRPQPRAMPQVEELAQDAAPAAEEWPELQPLESDLPAAPAFDAAALLPTIRAICSTERLMCSTTVPSCWGW